MTHRRWTRGALALAGAALLAALPALGARAQSKPKTRPLPDPVGTMVDGAARVCVYSDRMHGSPNDVPFANVKGPYRLYGFPYAAPGRWASVLFFRHGFAPVHLRVATPRPGDPAPRLGRAVPYRLPARTGCLAGMVIEGSPRGIVRYRRGAVVVTPLGRAEGGLTATAGRDGFFQRALSPGRYRVSLVGTTRDTTIDVHVGRTSFVVFDLRPARG